MVDAIIYKLSTDNPYCVARNNFIRNYKDTAVFNFNKINTNLFLRWISVFNEWDGN